MSSRTFTLLCAVILAAYATVLVKGWGAPGGWLLDDRGKAQQTDYLSLWAAGRLALQGKAASAYDWGAHEKAMETGLGYEPPAMLPYSYPPPFFAVLAPLALLPYLASMLLFSVLALVPFAIVNAWIVRRWEAAVWMCATVPAFWNLAVGQTGALVAGLLGAALLLLPAWPTAAGVLIGLLSFKPHLGLIIPVALIATRQWRAVWAAACTVLLMFSGSLVLFGPEPWLAFGPALSKFGAFVLSDANLDAFKLQSVYGVLRTLGAPPNVALTMQVVVALGLATLVWQVWRRPGAYDLKAGVLCCAAVLASPYVFHYDLILLTIAQAFLLRHALARGIDSGEVTLVVVVNVLVTLTQTLGFPMGFFASGIMLWALMRRTESEEATPAPIEWIPAKRFMPFGP